MRTRTIKRLLLGAVRLFRVTDAELLERNAAERAICGRLAAHLATSFPDHAVDVEYDRHGFDPKRLHLPGVCRGGGRRRVVPDIVIHQRGNHEDNVLAIELKKETNPESRACDRAKLRAMCTQLAYQVGVLIDVPAGRDSSGREVRFEWYGRAAAQQQRGD